MKEMRDMAKEWARAGRVAEAVKLAKAVTGDPNEIDDVTASSLLFAHSRGVRERSRKGPLDWEKEYAYAVSFCVNPNDMVYTDVRPTKILVLAAKAGDTKPAQLALHKLDLQTLTEIAASCRSAGHPDKAAIFLKEAAMRVATDPAKTDDIAEYCLLAQGLLECGQANEAMTLVNYVWNMASAGTSQSAGQGEQQLWKTDPRLRNQGTPLEVLVTIQARSGDLTGALQRLSKSGCPEAAAEHTLVDLAKTFAKPAPAANRDAHGRTVTGAMAMDPRKGIAIMLVNVSPGPGPFSFASLRALSRSTGRSRPGWRHDELCGALPRLRRAIFHAEPAYDRIADATRNDERPAVPRVPARQPKTSAHKQ